jgi:hypothetical protein
VAEVMGENFIRSNVICLLASTVIGSKESVAWKLVQFVKVRSVEDKQT